MQDPNYHGLTRQLSLPQPPFAARTTLTVKEEERETPLLQYIRSPLPSKVRLTLLFVPDFIITTKCHVMILSFSQPLLNKTATYHINAMCILSFQH